ncbi:MAG: hypothetical protein G01um101424_136 [Parcubacteria group bacterium Gr01-1014_24]|nr:MAG: hypothetical protein G01um101424_136 [Parcubacteria group bacterium Gr01-1014_24]
MSILPILVARVVMTKLIRAGFRYVGTKGSHYIFKNFINGRRTSVPYHSKTIGRGLLSKIIKQAGLTVKQFLDL